MEIVLIMVTVKTRTFLLGKKLVKQGLILTGKANSNQTVIMRLEDPKEVLVFHQDKLLKMQIISRFILAKSNN
jgi:hypothetical protein